MSRGWCFNQLGGLKNSEQISTTIHRIKFMQRERQRESLISESFNSNSIGETFTLLIT